MVPPPNGQDFDKLDIPGLRDEAVKNYSAWLEANIGNDSLKA
jgi:hypothetical protein